MRGYIDRELALSHPFANGEYDHKNANEDFILGFESYKEWLENQPDADVKEVHHAHWVCVNDSENVYMCDGDEGCGKTMQILEGAPMDNEFYYCPYCGASMKDE